MITDLEKNIKHRDGGFSENTQQLKAINYFCKEFHLRCLTGFVTRP